MKRTCKKCGVEKDIKKFVKQKTCKHGRNHTCSACRNKMNRTVCIQCKVCKIFFMETKQNAKNGAKYCCKYCMALDMRGVPRPKHAMEVMKKTWIKKGQRISKSTEFKKGQPSKNQKYFSEEQRLEANRKRKLLPQNIEKDKTRTLLNRSNITNTYVKALLATRSKLKTKDIPQCLVNLKRDEIRVKRLIKEQML